LREIQKRQMLLLIQYSTTLRRHQPMPASRGRAQRPRHMTCTHPLSACDIQLYTSVFCVLCGALTSLSALYLPTFSPLCLSLSLFRALYLSLALFALALCLSSACLFVSLPPSLSRSLMPGPCRRSLRGGAGGTEAPQPLDATNMMHGPCRRSVLP